MMVIREDPEGVETDVLFDLVDLGGCRVLEVGCGEGRFTWRFAPHAAQVVGIDPNAEMIEKARSSLPDSLTGQVSFQALGIEAYARTVQTPEFHAALFSWSL